MWKTLYTKRRTLLFVAHLNIIYGGIKVRVSMCYPNNIANLAAPLKSRAAIYNFNWAVVHSLVLTDLPIGPRIKKA